MVCLAPSLNGTQVLQCGLGERGIEEMAIEYTLAV